MRRIPIRESGLVGTFFAEGNPSSAIIVLGGSSGGLQEKQAEILAENGFAALALAYFAIEPLPPRLHQIPLEYFEKAILRVKRESGIEKIALWGGSRGAELALILGTLFPDQINAIAAHVPSSVVQGALDGAKDAAWLYQGKPIAPSAPFTYPANINGESEKTPINVRESFILSMQDREIYEKSAIQVERLKCPLLLISAEDDQMWPSSIYATQIVDRLKKYNSTIECSHINYKGVGHAPAKGTVGLHPIMKRWFHFGGNVEDNAFAAVDWIKQTIHFFQNSL